VAASATTAGDGETIYDITLHVRGVVETKMYHGACGPGARSATEGQWASGGSPNADNRDVFRLTISSPAQTYVLNPGPSDRAGTVALDFSLGVRVRGGGTITVVAYSIDGFELDNSGGDGGAVTASGAAIAQPYDGQFVEVEIGASAAETLPLRSAGSAGSALSFNGGQTATVTDAPSLRPIDLTLETWFMFDGFDPTHEPLIGKPYGPGSEDSYAIWYESSFNSGVSVFSPDDATSAMWTPVLGEWHHAAMTYDSGAGETVFYLDGQPSACLAGAGAPVYDGHDIYIGADTDADVLNGFWVGAIDEVRIFSRARSAAEVWADMYTDRLGPTEALVAEWTFDEGQGQTAADSSGNGNSATLGLTPSPEVADPSWVPSGVPP
jgi:hypothetical protein